MHLFTMRMSSAIFSLHVDSRLRGESSPRTALSHKTPAWWNGRRGGFKIRCPRGRVGSSPTAGTILPIISQIVLPRMSSGPVDNSLRGVDIVRTFTLGSETVRALRGVTLRVAAGEKVFLCGPSGAGKTTLLYVLGGLERPTSGSVYIGEKSLYAGADADSSKMRNAFSGYIFQSYLLLPELTALENVLLPAMIGGRSAKDRARELLARVGLEKRLHHLPSELSGGEQQRVAIARALVNDPRIIFADEPTGNLDSTTGAEIMQLLLSVVAESRKTLLIVTHDTRLAALGDRTLTLRDGQIESAVLSSTTSPHLV